MFIIGTSTQTIHITQQESPCCCTTSGFFSTFKDLVILARLLPTIHMANAPGSTLLGGGLFGTGATVIKR
jgi:hypothetical protein